MTSAKLLLPLVAAPDPAVVQGRCSLTRGDWCGRFDAQVLIPAVPPPRGTQQCLWNCNFAGVCDGVTGWCRCPAGWTGDDCATRLKVGVSSLDFDLPWSLCCTLCLRDAQGSQTCVHLPPCTAAAVQSALALAWV